MKTKMKKIACLTAATVLFFFGLTGIFMISALSESILTGCYVAVGSIFMLIAAVYFAWLEENIGI